MGIMISLPLIVVVLLTVLMVIFQYKRCVTRFNERFPPISDDEFVRRCGPGVNW